MNAREVWIIDAVRTPIGRLGGALASVRPDDLAAIVVRALLERTGFDPAELGDVYFGAANQSGEDNRNLARMAALLAGLPVEVPGATFNRLCGSSLQAINSATHAIAWGECDAIVAGGVESMTRAPYVMPKSAQPFARDARLYDTTLGWRMVNPKMPERWTISLGETAERVAEIDGISREAQDRFAVASQEKCAAAFGRGAFASELVPVTISARDGERSIDRDEHPRPDTSYERLSALAPAFRENGTVTAGNSSGLNDGAAALLLVEAQCARRHALQPMARVLATGVAGVAPEIMGIGPVPATQAALRHAGLRLDEIELVELNEAFAAQSLACIGRLGLDAARVNVNGGAIALGHPLGASGARIATTLLHEMRRRNAKFGAATMCIGVGQGIATIFEGMEAV
ncbi:MAG: acetyl-CoA C-acyltransferase [Candidatus Eremiobacteraeota bacterium]|nr:acetyl-CoA C-acyltransferase [Candidatus Eremiobacteraeota bacterium]NNM93031.1 acetyl-CoA C-acyltransferase [Candidatus Eremiobacteraeota bacterium]